MAVAIRTATTDDIASMADLLVRDAKVRAASDSQLWRLADDARRLAAEAVHFALTAETRPFRQTWLVAESGNDLVGLIHTIRLPVPPIYAGCWGDPGLIMPECFVTKTAPEGTLSALIDAAEADLRNSGARVLLAAHAGEEKWRSAFEAKGYAPLTLYLSKSGLTGVAKTIGIRPADVADIDQIVALSATNRQVLFDLDAFWEPHSDADKRFANWMRTSLTLKDRDMLVCGTRDGIDGYIIAQPATRLHFPAAHDIAGIGVIDDWFHMDFADPGQLNGAAGGAAELLRAGAAALRDRGRATAFVVCPAAWASKVSLLEREGYHTALTWMIRR